MRSLVKYNESEIGVKFSPSSRLCSGSSGKSNWYESFELVDDCFELSREERGGEKKLSNIAPSQMPDMYRVFGG